MKISNKLIILWAPLKQLKQHIALRTSIFRDAFVFPKVDNDLLSKNKTA